MANNNSNTIDRELGWYDTIENDSPDFILLQEGEYDFVVDHFDRERFSGSDKMPACNKAVLFLNVETPDGTAVVRESLFMHTKGEGKLCAFFTAIGQRQHGQKLRMNWSTVPGARGRAKIGVREYQGKSYNEVKKFLEPEAPAAAPAYPQNQPAAWPQQPSYQPGAPAYQQPPTYQGTPNYQQPATGGYVPGKF